MEAFKDKDKKAEPDDDVLTKVSIAVRDNVMFACRYLGIKIAEYQHIRDSNPSTDLGIKELLDNWRSKSSHNSIQDFITSVHTAVDTNVLNHQIGRQIDHLIQEYIASPYRESTEKEKQKHKAFKMSTDEEQEQLNHRLPDSLIEKLSATLLGNELEICRALRMPLDFLFNSNKLTPELRCLLKWRRERKRSNEELEKLCLDAMKNGVVDFISYGTFEDKDKTDEPDDDVLSKVSLSVRKIGMFALVYLLISKEVYQQINDGNPSTEIGIKELLNNWRSKSSHNSIQDFITCIQTAVDTNVLNHQIEEQIDGLVEEYNDFYTAETTDSVSHTPETTDSVSHTPETTDRVYHTPETTDSVFHTAETTDSVSHKRKITNSESGVQPPRRKKKRCSQSFDPQPV